MYTSKFLRIIPLLLLQACSSQDREVYGCVDEKNVGTRCPDELTYALEQCTGDCLPVGPAGFRREPLLLWYGDQKDAPACPEHAKGEYWTGNDGLVAGPNCPLCTCGTSQCELPAGVAAMSDSICQGPGYIPLDAPPGWDGTCNSPVTVAPGTFASIAIAPPSAGACEVIAVPLPPKLTDDYSWTTFARACDGLVNGACTASNEMCSPTAKPPPPGFHQCIAYEAAIDEAKLPMCPSAYPEQHVFYGAIDDQRQCTDCECGEPLGTQCIARVSAFQDPACGPNPLPLFENVPIGLADGPLCTAVMSGAGLGAWSADWAVNKLGACIPSGGVAFGEAKPSDAHVFCCQAATSGM